MIAATAHPHLKPPAIVSPQPYRVSFGSVWGRVGQGTERILVRVDGKTRAKENVHGRRFSVSVPLPRHDAVVRVIAIGRHGHSSASVAHVFGLPRRSAPRGVRGYKKPALERPLRRLVRRYPGIAAFYVEDLETGAGAGWNAAARFPAASTLKLAIAVELLRSMGRPPPHGSYVDSVMTRMLDYSDNVAANTLLGLAGGGYRVTATMQLLGLRNTEMYGGYIPGTIADRRGKSPIPSHVNAQPSLGIGKYTTAHDLARLLQLVHLAATHKGRLAHKVHGFSTADARYLLYVLAHVRDPGKLGRFVHGGGVAVLHKAGWISDARHDAGLVYWPGGVFVAAVMTWNGAGAGTSSDVLAGSVARETLSVLRKLRL